MLSACGVWSWLFELFLGSSLSCYFGTGTSLAVLFMHMERIIRAGWNGVLGAKLFRTWVV